MPEPDTEKRRSRQEQHKLGKMDTQDSGTERESSAMKGVQPSGHLLLVIDIKIDLYCGHSSSESHTLAFACCLDHWHTRSSVTSSGNWRAMLRRQNSAVSSRVFSPDPSAPAQLDAVLSLGCPSRCWQLSQMGQCPLRQAFVSYQWFAHAVWKR